MRIDLDDLDDVDDDGTHTREVMLDAGKDLVLGIHLDADEELAQARLWLARATGTHPLPSPTFTIATDQGTSLSNITWVCVDWRTTHTLTQITLPTITAADPIWVRMQVARGASSWYSPPGPHTFSPATSGSGSTRSLTASLPDTVADRVMLEFLAGTDMTPPTRQVTLGDPPELVFGRHARDVSLAVRGKRQVSAIAGELTEKVELSGLLEALREQGVALAGPTQIPLVLRAGAAGWCGIEWKFVVDNIGTSFPGPPARSCVSVELPFDGRVEVPLLEQAARVESLELSLTHAPERERLLVRPEPGTTLGEALGELIRPGTLSAQRFELLAPAQLVGASIWARPLAGKVRLVASLLADRAGTPAQTLASVTLELDEPDSVRAPPRWIEIDFAELVEAPVGPHWLAIGCEVGELSWIVADTPPPTGVGALRQSRRGGAWLTRAPQEPGSWALLRIRAHEPGELPSPTLTLIGETASTNPTRIELKPDAEGRLRWAASASAPELTGAISLHVHTPIPTTLTLDRLRLRWRPLA